MKLGYLLRYFPTVSETFVADEIAEVSRQHRMPALWALDPGADGPTHPGQKALLEACRYVPRAHHPRILAGGLGGGEIAETWEGWGCRRKDLRRALYLARACRGDGIDHLHVHFAAEAAEAAWVARRHAGIPYSVTVHARDLYCPRPSLPEAKPI